MNLIEVESAATDVRYPQEGVLVLDWLPFRLLLDPTTNLGYVAGRNLPPPSGIEPEQRTARYTLEYGCTCQHESPCSDCYRPLGGVDVREPTIDLSNHAALLGKRRNWQSKG